MTNIIWAATIIFAVATICIVIATLVLIWRHGLWNDKDKDVTNESSEETLIAVQAGSKYVTINGKPAHPPGMHEVFKYCKTCDDIRNKS